MQGLSTTSHGRTHRIVIWMMSAIVVVAGVYLSMIRFMGHEWLSRAGCLVVVLGIGSGLGGIIQERVISGRIEVRRRIALARTRRDLRRSKTDTEQAATTIAALDKEYDDRLAALNSDLRLSVGILEVSLLITGTLLWGFGDLLADIL